MQRKCEIRVEGLRLERNADNQRVAAEVNGETLYFESPGADLRASPEGFASALLVAALKNRANLVFEVPLDPVFLTGITHLMQVFIDWWGYKAIEIRSESPPASHSLPLSGAPIHGGGTALCFSGGADSFYSLLCGEERIDSLIFVYGFDIRLSDAPRANSFRSSLGCVARKVSARPILLRTNLREHSVSKGVHWERAHGGALAAVGHLVAGTERLVVAASFPSCFPHPWGSRWDIDPHWSSGSMKVVHHGEDQWRGDKLRALASKPIVRSHLRVCWEHLSHEANCSRCEKCVRTMLTLAQCGALEEFPVFDSTGSLAERVARLGGISPILRPVYEGFLDPEIDRETTRSLRALLAAKDSLPKRLSRRKMIWKKFKHALFG